MASGLLPTAARDIRLNRSDDLLKRQRIDGSETRAGLFQQRVHIGNLSQVVRLRLDNPLQPEQTAHHQFHLLAERQDIARAGDFQGKTGTLLEPLQPLAAANGRGRREASGAHAIGNGPARRVLATALRGQDRLFEWAADVFQAEPLCVPESGVIRTAQLVHGVDQGRNLVGFDVLVDAVA